MAYPPAPGTTGSSLPPKPPTPATGANSTNNGSVGPGAGFAKKSSFKPAFSPPPTVSYQSSSYSSAPGTYSATPPTTYGPSAPPPQQYGQSYSSSHSAAPAPSTVSSAPYTYPQQQASHQSQNWTARQNNWQSQSRPQQTSQSSYNQPRQSQPPSSYGPQSQPTQGYGAQNYGQASTYNAPPIQNPYNRQSGAQGMPAGGQGEYGSAADDAAQIAQWQSAYVTREPAPLDKDGKPIEQPKPADPAYETAYTQAANNNIPAANPDKKKTVVRSGGGKKWQDDSLLEWDPAHLRLFVGNLAGETTDDALLKAFSRWSSVQKARVVRDKRTSKSKGYGFVSFSNADEFFNAAKEMNGKYVQSHPVIVKKATTEIKTTNVKDKNHKKYKNNNYNKNKNNDNAGHSSHDSPSLGPKPGAGIVKPGQKTKNGLKLLG